MVSPKFKRLKTLNTTHTDRNRHIATVTAATTTSTTTISYLPDHIIEHILSFLPIKLAAQATAVSKHWASLWPSFPELDFDDGEPSESDDPSKFRRFLRFLENCLQRCQNQRSLYKLRLRILHSLAGDDSVTIGKCVTFAIERCVTELELCFVENEVSFYQIPQTVFSSHFLMRLSLENVSISFGSSSINLPSLMIMSLKEVDFDYDKTDLEILLSGCPRLLYLELNQCDLGYTQDSLKVFSSSIKYLKILNCHAMDFEVKCMKLEIFMFDSNCTCAHHGGLTVLQCDNLRCLAVDSVGLKELHLVRCEKSFKNLICTPNLRYFLFSGVAEAKVNFLQSRPSLLHATIRITNDWWSFEYFSFLRDCLASFNCCEDVEIDIRDAEGVIIPEHCRREWSPPLLNIKQLQLTFANPLCDRDYLLDPSLTWIAPNAKILPHQYNSTIPPVEQ